MFIEDRYREHDKTVETPRLQVTKELKKGDNQIRGQRVDQSRDLREHISEHNLPESFVGQDA